MFDVNVKKDRARSRTITIGENEYAMVFSGDLVTVYPTHVDDEEPVTPITFLFVGFMELLRTDIGQRLVMQMGKDALVKQEEEMLREGRL